MDAPLILASASPRRLELLSQIGVSCEVVPADVDESVLDGETPTELVERLSRLKAATVAGRCPNRVVLAADTVVYLPGESPVIFGKPADEAQAMAMLDALSDSVHEVVTGFTVHDGVQIHTESVITQVTFAAISHTERLRYWQSGEPVGKAGGYAIQGLGARFVVGIQGSYSNVVGLPLYETASCLARTGIIA